MSGQIKAADASIQRAISEWAKVSNLDEAINATHDALDLLVVKQDRLSEGRSQPLKVFDWLGKLIWGKGSTRGKNEQEMLMNLKRLRKMLEKISDVTFQVEELDSRLQKHARAQVAKVAGRFTDRTLVTGGLQ